MMLDTKIVLDTQYCLNLWAFSAELSPRLREKRPQGARLRGIYCWLCALPQRTQTPTELSVSNCQVSSRGAAALKILTLSAEQGMSKLSNGDRQAMIGGVESAARGLDAHGTG